MCLLTFGCKLDAFPCQLKDAMIIFLFLTGDDWNT